MIAHQVEFNSEGNRPGLGQLRAPVVLPPDPATVSQNQNGAPSMQTLLVIGLAALAAVVAVTMVAGNVRD